MTVGELMTNIIKMLEEDRINITDEVQMVHGILVHLGYTEQANDE